MKPKNDKQMRWESSPRWVRVQLNNEFVADSKNVLAVWEHGRYPAYFFPPEDVRADFLQPTGRSHDGRHTWHVQVGDKEAPNAAYSYTHLTGENKRLNGYIVFRWHKMDHWFEEAEEVYVHARDPHHRVDTVASSRHIKVMIEGVTVAETTRPYLLFETNLPTRYYIPPQDVKMDLLTPTDTVTQCPYKGDAAYWTVDVNGRTHKDIAWGYPNPILEIPKIKGLLSFYNEKVDVYVDGKLEPRPQTAWS
ncbi:MAG: DUF427 domain-containing protein [Chloroflexi bacterium]|nr:DUF427 domain-containing protein [Chloroflexota bacterium]